MKEEKAKLIYRALSGTNFMVSIIARLSMLFAIFYLYLHFRENPIVISICIIVVLFFFLIYGSTEILIYEDRIERNDNSLVSFFITKKPKILFIKNIKKCYVEEQVKPNKDVFADVIAVLFGAALAFSSANSRNHEHRYYNRKSTKIIMQNNDGSIDFLFVDFDEKRVNKITEVINHLSKQVK